jgi:hypothetical protein
MCFPKYTGGGGLGGLVRNLEDVATYNQQYNASPHSFTSGPSGTVQSNSNNQFSMTPEQYAASKGVATFQAAPGSNFMGIKIPGTPTQDNTLSSLFKGASTAMGASRLIK